MTHLMNQQYEDTKKKLRDRQKDEHNSFRRQRLISETAKKILKKKTKRLNLEDYKDIALSVYKRNDKIIAKRIKTVMNQDIVKEQVNNKIQELLIREGLDDKKYIDLIKKAESVAKTTKDFIQIANEIKEMNSLAPAQKRIVEKRTVDYTKYLGDGEKATVKQIEESEYNVSDSTNGEISE